MKGEPGSKTPEKICPECGRDLTDVDIEAHTKQHYGDIEPNPRKFKDAAKRWKILMKMAEGA